MTARGIITTILLTLSGAVSATAQTAVADYITELRSSAALRGAVWSVLAVNLRGDTLACVNSGLNLVPASNTKLLTCGAALHALGGDFRFGTSLRYSGSIEDGVLHGDLYIAGGGDPTTGARDGCAPAAEVTFASWKRLLDKAGVSRIDGMVIGDSRMMPPDGGCPDWSVEDRGFYYGIEPQGLNFYENIQDLRATPGAAPGEPVVVEEVYPECPWMIYAHSCVTGPAGCGDQLYYSASDTWPFGSMTGYLGVDKGVRLEQCANRYGAYTCASYFCRFLERQGVKVSRGPADIGPDGIIREDLGLTFEQRAAAGPEELHEIGQVQGPPLANIIKETLWRSDNFYAQALFKALGLQYTHCAEADSCIVAERQLLKTMGAAASAIQIRDGSGLSRKTYIPTGYFVKFLCAMTRTGEYKTFVEALPSPGQGTLALCLSGTPVSVKARIRMKSGSMDGTRGYSGYILPPPGAPDEDTIVFSVIANNATATQGQLRKALDRIVLLLAQSQ